MNPPPTERPGARNRLRAIAFVSAAIVPSGVLAAPHLTIVDQQQTWNSAIGISSEYLAARAVPGPTKPVVMAGRFDLEVSFPGPAPWILIGSPGVDSVFAGILDHDGSDWTVSSPTQIDKLEPRSVLPIFSPTSELRDLAVVDRSDYYLTGIIGEGTFFRNRNGTDFLLTPDSTGLPQRGFLARGGNGTFTSAHYTDLTMQPRALATNPAGTSLVIVGQERDNGAGDFEGTDAKIHCYSLPLPPSGTPLPAPDTISDSQLQNTALFEVVLGSSNVFIGGTRSGGLGGSQDVWLARADFAANQIVKPFLAGSESLDNLTKMERGPNEEIYVAFTVRGRQVSFGNRLNFDLDAASAASSSTHAFVGRISPSGVPEWLTPLGLSQAGGSVLEAVDLSIDEAGNTYVTVQGTGAWLIEGVSETLTDPGQITLSTTGRVLDFTALPAVDTARAGAVPDLENRLVFGETGGQSSFATLEAGAVQQDSYVVRWKRPSVGTGRTIEALSALVTQRGGQVHLAANFIEHGYVAVSAYLTRRQVNDLQLNLELDTSADPVTVGPDAAACGEVSNPGWALARLFNPSVVNVTDPSVLYRYPSAFVTAASPVHRKVRVYVTRIQFAKE